MAELLRSLRREGIEYLDVERFPSITPSELERISDPYSRRIEIDALASVLNECMRQFSENKQASDAWLAPRVHACLRLFRREAADRSLWNFLALRFASYVVWRWAEETDKPDQKRISGPTNRQALARLWWLAELTRNGSDYSAIEDACRIQETTQWLLDTDAFQNRSAALAFLRFLGSDSNGERIRAVAKSLNHVLTTVSLDCLAPAHPVDVGVLRDWINEAPDETLPPVGPDELPEPDESIEAVLDILRRVNADA